MLVVRYFANLFSAGLKNIILFIITVFLFSSCETDFDTNAEWKDITVIYGLLDQKNSLQYLKINKAFLGEGNALIYAQEPDSSNYPYLLEVKIEEWDEAGNYLIKTIEFDTTTIYNKEPGIFYYPEQIIYKSKPYDYYEIKYVFNIHGDTVSREKFWLNDKSIYRLCIKNLVTGKEITAETQLVHDFDITKPGLINFIKFTNHPESQTEFEWDRPCDADDWNECKNQQLKNELVVIFNYGELEIDSWDTVQKSIILISSSLYPKPSDDELNYYYRDENFFYTCLNKIPYYDDPAKEANIIGRYSGNVDVIVSVAGEEYTLYMQVYEPSTSIVQEKPQYTNIDNGIGIFSSRYKKSKSKRIHTETVADLQDIDDNVLKFEW